MTCRDRREAGDAPPTLGRSRLLVALVGLAALSAAAVMAGASVADEPDRPPAKDPPAEAAANYLLKAYPPARVRVERPTFDPEAALRRVELKTLEACLPGTRFVSTRLKSSSEFPEIDVVVAVGREPGEAWRGRAACLTPVYKAPTREFLDLFKGVKADPDIRLGDLAADIARLFEAATHDGHLGDMRYEGGEFRYDLFKGEQHWRTVAVSFGADRRITEVRLFNPSQPRTAPQPGENKASPQDKRGRH